MDVYTVKKDVCQWVILKNGEEIHRCWSRSAAIALIEQIGDGFDLSQFLKDNGG